MACIRGAITCDKNDYDEIVNRTKELLDEIIKMNILDINKIESILFTATNDLTKAYPAVAARAMGITKAALMCMQEMYVENSLRMCIRIMITVTGVEQDDAYFVYLRDAERLRPDIAKKHLAIAIDGPSGSGKSTAARVLAKELGFIYVDTGAMYRAVALYCSDNGVDCADAEAVGRLLNQINISLEYSGSGEQRLMLNGRDVTERLRTQETAEGASKVAPMKAVRTKLVTIQRIIARKNNVVMDGRDIASNVLPWAQVKIYMDASVEERTNRRMSELLNKGIAAMYNETKNELEERDYRDINRTESPLIKVPDAVYIDTGSMNEDEVKNALLKIVKQRSI